MTSRLSRLLAPLLVAGVVGALVPTAGAAAANRDVARRAVSTTVYGSVSNLVGTCVPVKKPVKPRPTCTFTVTEPTTQTTVEVTVLSTTTMTPISSEAFIEGFQDNDWVIVRGRQVATLVAAKVTYNDTPFPLNPNKFRQTKGKYVSFVAATATTPPVLTIVRAGTDLTFMIGPKTHYRVNGRAVAKMPAFLAGDTYQISSQLCTDNNQWTVSVWLTRKKKK